jgi:hypothetical protein
VPCCYAQCACQPVPCGLCCSAACHLLAARRCAVRRRPARPAAVLLLACCRCRSPPRLRPPFCSARHRPAARGGGREGSCRAGPWGGAPEGAAPSDARFGRERPRRESRDGMEMGETSSLGGRRPAGCWVLPIGLFGYWAKKKYICIRSFLGHA